MFLSVDPKASSARTKSPLTWNRYGYNAGDPINGLDPSGSDEICYGAPGDYDASHCFYNPYDVIEQNPPDPTQTVNQDGAPTDDNCTPTESNPSPDPSCGTGPPPPPIQPPPACEVEVGYVPWVGNFRGSGLIPGKHTFFYVEDSSGWNVVDAGPSTYPKLTWVRSGWIKLPVLTGFGNLITNVSPLGLYNESTNPGSNMYWEHPEPCVLVRTLEVDAESLSNVVLYSLPQRGRFWYNSNSFTSTVIMQVGLSVPAPPVWAPGWGNYIP